MSLAIGIMKTAEISVNLIPQPVKLEIHDAVLEHAFMLSAATKIKVAKPFKGCADQLRSALKGSSNSTLTVVEFISDPSLKDEEYRLESNSNSVIIRASKYAGAHHGLQTLFQLANLNPLATKRKASYSVPSVSIVDYPRFSWRGGHLDCGRHFLPTTFVKKYIDLLAMHKFNVFHWHLTEDQGWRIEIKKYPKLTSIGAWRSETLVGKYGSNKYDGIRHGGFYTQKEVKEIVAYASQRAITVVPEIEMPGHSQAVVAAYPEFGNVKEPIEVMKTWGVTDNVLNLKPKTIQFLKDVLSEVLALFPSQFIHIGGDESPRTQWKTNPDMLKIVEHEKLGSVDHLQAWLNKQISEWLHERGRRMIGWDEILEGGLAPGSAVMSWRGEQGGIDAANLGHDVVMAPNPYTYLDYYQSGDTAKEPLAIGGLITLQKAYEYEPEPKQVPADKLHHILGGQFQIWTEYISSPAKVEYMAYPRAMAIAEKLWSSHGASNFPEFEERLKPHLEDFFGTDRTVLRYRPLSGPDIKDKGL